MKTKPPRAYSAALALFRAVIPNRWLRWGAVGLLWTLIGFMSASHWSFFPMGDYPYSWWELYRVKIALWYVWGGVTPVILWLGARFHLVRPIRWMRLTPLVIASILLTIAYLVVYTEILLFNISGTVASAQYWNMFRFVISRHSTFYLLAFWALIGLEHAVAFYRRSHERELRASQLEAMLAQAHLSALQSRLQPHFLFNSLHSVVALIRSNRSAEATAMVTGISDLLRQTLVHMDQDEVSLEAELGLLRKYVEIEQVRFSDRLRVCEEIDPETRDVRVPPFLLQPLVENAIKHGVERKAGSGKIVIRSRRCNASSVVVEVIDDGPGLASTAESSSGGVGLSATRERLERLYGDDSGLVIEPRAEGGTVTRVTLPFRTGDTR